MTNKFVYVLRYLLNLVKFLRSFWHRLTRRCENNRSAQIFESDFSQLQGNEDVEYPKTRNEELVKNGGKSTEKMREDIVSKPSNFSIKKSFWILLCAVFLMGYLTEFTILFFLILLHEISHVLAAKLCGSEISSLTIMPLGLSATIKDFDFLPTIQKVFILLSGPLLNLILAGAAFTFFGESVPFFIGANLSIFIFNMLPILPLDGGNLFMTLLNNKLGILPTADILASMGRFFAAIVVILGFIQVVLYPYNISLICLGVYLFRASKDRSISYQNAFIKILTLPCSKKKIGFLPVKQIALSNEGSAFDTFNALRLFGFNCYTIIHIVGDKGVLNVITEEEIVNHLTKMA